MMQQSLPDSARLQPTFDALNIILKNTHFSDHILKDAQKVKLRIDFRYPIATAVIRFGEAYFDFILPLRLSYTNTAITDWLNQTSPSIKLVLADPVITDQLSILPFTLDENEREKLRVNIKEQADLSPLRLGEIENQIYADVNSFFRDH